MQVLTQHTTPFPRGSAPSACSPSSSCSASASASGSPGGGSRAGGILTPIMVISTPSGVMTMSLAMKPNGLHTSAATYVCACVCECACVHACLCACVLSLLCGVDQLGWPRANCRPQGPRGTKDRLGVRERGGAGCQRALSDSCSSAKHCAWESVVRLHGNDTRGFKLRALGLLLAALLGHRPRSVLQAVLCGPLLPTAKLENRKNKKGE